MKKLIFIFLLLLLISSTCYAEEYWYPEGKWNWASQNIAYVLKEYDKYAPKPGCIEWLDRTGFVDFTGKHNLPQIYVFISAAKDAHWGYSQDYKQPEVGSIVYWDSNPGAPDYAYAIALVRKIDGELLTIEYWDSEKQQPAQYTRKISDMRITPSGRIFRGYIYPRKVET